MKILFIAMGHSVHTARWISQLDGLCWDVHFFPVDQPGRLHPNIRNVTVHGAGLWRMPQLAPGLKVAGEWPFRRGAFTVERWLQRHHRSWTDRAWQLARTIRRLKPDIVHSLEMQHAGYLTLASRRWLGNNMPPWVYSSWGSDIYHFRKDPEHSARVREVLSTCDYLITDCQRDVALAGESGFKGKTLGVFPGVGGFDIDAMQACRVPGPVALRRTLAIKGYQHWAGRALNALQAVHRCSDILRDYEIVVYSMSPGVQYVVDHMAAVSGLNIRGLPESAHVDILRLMGRSRIALGVNVSDGTPNSMLEATVMGALPVQSDTGSTAEWIQDGVNGLLVPPEDVGAIERAIRRALSDDRLVDRAAELNAQMTRERIDRQVVRPQVIKAYERVLAESGKR